MRKLVNIKTLKTYLKKEPYSVNLFITNRCNSKCRICNIWKEKKKVNLKKEEFEKIIAKSRLLKNVKQFNITGGEAVLNKDMSDLIGILVRYAKPVKISVGTNGLSPNFPNIMGQLVDRYGKNRFRIKVSLDGTSEVYKKIRGVDGYSQVVKTISALIKSNLDVSIGFTVTDDNYLELEKLKKMFGNRIIVHPVDSIGFYKVKVSSKKPFKMSGHKSVFFNLYSKFVSKTMERGRRIHKCYAGSVSVVIDQDLNVYSCIKKPILFGNLADYGYDFDKLWKSNIKRIRKTINASDCYCYCTGDIVPSIIRDFRWFFK